MGAEFFQSHSWRFERIMRERPGIHSAEEMMHYGIAYDDDIANLGARFSRNGNELLDEPADLFTNQFLKPVLTMFQYREVNPAHHIGAVPRLRVESSLHRQHSAGLQVQELSNESRSA